MSVHRGVLLTSRHFGGMSLPKWDQEDDLAGGCGEPAAAAAPRTEAANDVGSDIANFPRDYPYVTSAISDNCRSFHMLNFPATLETTSSQFSVLWTS